MTAPVKGDVILTKTLTSLDAEPWQQLAAASGGDIPAPLGKVHVVLLLDTLIMPDAEAFDLDAWLNQHGWRFVGPPVAKASDHASS